jgi:hypothetical protein
MSECVVGWLLSPDRNGEGGILNVVVNMIMTL